MQSSVLVIEKYGAYVNKSGNRFVVKTDGTKKEYSADKISQLLFVSPSAISTNAIELAVEKNIDIVYLNWRGDPFARTYRPTLGGTTLTRRKQLESYFTEKGGRLVYKLVEGKIKSQQNFLKSLAKDRKANRNLQEIAENEINSQRLKGTIDEIRNTLLGKEGAAAATYFKGLGLITGFKNRDRKATDEFNICLNYGYGMLYSEMERACILAGLDPYLGFYHTDRYGKPSMVLDIMELFRVAVADRAIVTLFTRGEINKSDFDLRGDKTLTQSGRKKIIEAVIRRLNTTILYRGKKLSLKDIILSQTREIVAYLLGHKRDFRPFIYQ